MGKMLWEDDADENRYEEGAQLTNEQALYLYIEYKTMVKNVGPRAEEGYGGKISAINKICAEELRIADWNWQLMRPKVMDRVIVWMRKEPKRDKNGDLVLDSSGRKQRKYSDTSILRYVVVAKGFYSWLADQKLVGRNLLEGFKNPTVSKEHGVGGGATATFEEFNTLIKATWEYYESPLAERGMRGKRGYRERRLHALRNQAMIMFLAATERRPAEMCRIKRSQVRRLEDGRGVLSLGKSQTKNKKEDTVYIDSLTMDAIDAYQEMRDKQRFPSGDQGWLFCMEAEHPRTGNQAIASGRWSIIFRRIFQFAKSKGYVAADRKLTPYSLKRFAYTETIEKSIMAAMAQAGHTSGIGIAAHYVRDKSRSQLERGQKVLQEVLRRIALDQVGLTNNLTSVRLK